MKKHLSAVLVVCLVVVFGIGFLQSSISYKKIKSDTTSIPSLYQPEAEAYLRATNPQREALNPTSFGSILDNPLMKKIGSLGYSYDKETCKGQSYSCFTPYYKSLVEEYGVTTAFIDIKKRYNDNPDVVTMCHPLTHVIGSQASKVYANVSEAYLHGDGFCWSGYYHGIMEGFVDRIGRENLPTQLDTMCTDIPGKKSYSFDYYNCVHGLGHGVMEGLSHNVFTSLEMCDNLTGSWERESCYGGVFMENIIHDNKEHNSKYLTPSEPFYPCTAVDTKYKSACYLGQSSYALQINNYDFKKIFALCNSVDDDESFRNICNQSMGRDAANVVVHDALKTKATCALAADALGRLNCIIGAVKEFISYYHSDTQANGLCKVVDDADRVICTTTATQYYKQF